MSDGCQNYDKGQMPPRTGAQRRFAEAPGLDDALVCLQNIAREYGKLCDVMLEMPERASELKEGKRIMDALESLRDKLLKRKSSNDRTERSAGNAGRSQPKESNGL